MSKKQVNEQAPAAALKKRNSLIGLYDVKRTIHRYVNVDVCEKERSLMLDEGLSAHSHGVWAFQKA